MNKNEEKKVEANELNEENLNEVSGGMGRHPLERSYDYRHRRHNPSIFDLKNASANGWKK